METRAAPLQTLFLGRPGTEKPNAGTPTQIAERMLRTMLASASTSEEFCCRALSIVRRALLLEMGALYLIDPHRPDSLRLYAAEGLNEAFDTTAYRLPLSDYADIADLPYNSSHGGCWGDFFAPVARSFHMRAWLFLSLPAGTSAPLRAAMLLGSGSPVRFHHADAEPAFALARYLSCEMSDRFPLP